MEKLFNDARASLSAQSAWIKLTLWHKIPTLQCSDQGIVQLTNLLLVCMSEYHLMRMIRGCGPILPPEIEGQLRDLREYLPHNDAGFSSTDVWEKDKGNLMRLACWLHHLNMAFGYSRGMAQSLRREDHKEIGNLLRYLIAPGVGPLTSSDVIDRVLQENEDDTLRQLEEAKDSFKSGKVRLPKIEEEKAEAKRELRHIQKQHTAQPSDVQHAQRKYEHLCQEKEKKRRVPQTMQVQIGILPTLSGQTASGRGSRTGNFCLGRVPHQLTTITVEPLPRAEGSTPSEGQDLSTGDDMEMQDNAL